MNQNDRNRFISSQKMGAEVLCPKPRRALVVACSGTVEMLKPARRSKCQYPLPAEGEAGHEILEILFSKVKAGDASNSAIPNPSFCGSPPSRAGNPLVHDVQFSQRRLPTTPTILPQKLPGKALTHDVHFTQRRGPPPAAVLAQKSPGSCIFGSHSQLKNSSCSSFGPNPSIRIEGFASSASDPHRGVPAYA